MDIPLYVVDAFTDKPFQGNPAAVCPLNAWLDDDLMQAIAAENNLSETAFLVPAGDSYELRWFTPKVEVDLCGHATLASAFVLAMTSQSKHPVFRFQTKSGELTVSEKGGWFTLDFPARELEDIEDAKTIINQIGEACGLRPDAVIKAAANCMAVYSNEKIIRMITPDFAKVAALDFRGLVITAPGDRHDFVSRFFAPRVGINEDPVTGSIHCGLIPYWHRKTGKTELHAFQASGRGGELICHHRGERVEISGQGVLFSEGKIHI